jgi:hypothetical protein
MNSSNETAKSDMLPTKPAFASPCNHCGLCCRTSLCHIGEMMFPRASAPCPAITIEDGKALCGIVLTERAFTLAPLAAESLGIGCGCSMEDEDTTEEQAKAFDAASRLKLFGEVSR